MSQLPPPPPGALPPHPDAPAPHPADPWSQFPQTAPAGPSWRSGKVGWVFLNIVIGLGIGIGIVFVAWAAIGAGHFDIATLDRAINESRTTANLSLEAQRIFAAVGASFLLGIAAGLAGWLLFVYLRVRTGVRVTVLVVITVLGAIGGYAILAAALPKLAGY